MEIKFKFFLFYFIKLIRFSKNANVFNKQLATSVIPS